ncbi:MULTISPECIES: metallophosphoesterase family protein [Rhodopirellula]|uniref:Metallophosphoesterase n=1 Tax=Rhodopirellula sallentina SM41 TaxID=1263870 RepID=M5TRK3_9BACT|nr:metallophosphoesterase family protein [Rhodopirellula sallentina]EMI51812.1 metallophosphoesterase [Rhodopirellula sallentina SM41]
MKRALISDIHGNLEALQAVMADIDAIGVDEIYCLGDIIGYGPNPCECLDLVMRRCKQTILGNHDQAALFDPDGFNPMALRAIYWTRDQLDAGNGSQSQVNARWDFLGELPRFLNDDPYRFVHGSPRDPTNEYVFPEYVYDTRKMEILFGKIDQYCFMGHTHLPGIFTTTCEFISPEECDNTYTLGSAKLLINVGSVGQPRDENNRSCYLILDTDSNTITYRRVEYDIEATATKIYNEPDLDNALGDRLKRGH